MSCWLTQNGCTNHGPSPIELYDRKHTRHKKMITYVRLTSAVPHSSSVMAWICVVAFHVLRTSSPKVLRVVAIQSKATFVAASDDGCIVSLEKACRITNVWSLASSHTNLLPICLSKLTGTTIRHLLRLFGAGFDMSVPCCSRGREGEGIASANKKTICYHRNTRPKN